MECAAAIETRACVSKPVAKLVAIGESVAVGDVGGMVVHRPSVVPVHPPVVPPPGKTAEEADTEGYARIKGRPVIIDSRNPNPIRIGR
jgi:hypothetical protein